MDDIDRLTNEVNDIKKEVSALHIKHIRFEATTSTVDEVKKTLTELNDRHVEYVLDTTKLLSVMNLKIQIGIVVGSAVFGLLFSYLEKVIT